MHPVFRPTSGTPWRLSSSSLRLEATAYLTDDRFHHRQVAPHGQRGSQDKSPLFSRWTGRGLIERMLNAGTLNALRYPGHYFLQLEAQSLRGSDSQPHPSCRCDSHLRRGLLDAHAQHLQESPSQPRLKQGARALLIWVDPKGTAPGPT